MTPTETKARRERDKITKETGPEGVMRQITDYLTAEGIPWFRMNSGEAVVDGRRIKLHPKGTTDLLAIIPAGRTFVDRYSETQAEHAVPFWIETKRPRAAPSNEQNGFAGQMIHVGCIHVWASDVSDVMRWLPPRLKR
jgi:hypothetical protein